MKKACLLLLITALINTTHAQTYTPNWQSLDARPVPAWFGDAKFGIFIHWGLYSVPSWGPTAKDGAGVYERYAEWYWYRLMDTSAGGKKVHDMFKKFHDSAYGPKVKYQDFVKDFTCNMFNAAEWASIIKSSGAKYVVLTSKHHEGFTLWPSKQAWNWNAVDIGPHRDLAGELSNAVKAAGLHMGFYYSLYEWFNPTYKTDFNTYVDGHMVPQMKDLVEKYHPDILWTDGEWEHTSAEWKSEQFLSWLYNQSSVKDNIVVNDRWGSDTRSKHGGIFTTEYDLEGDNNLKNKVITHPWEECRGIGSSFGYNRNEDLADYQTPEQLVGVLIEKVSRGGNLLLDIGPTADGRIPVIMQQRLIDMGDWLAINGDAIYGTTGWANAPDKKDPSISFTVKGNDLYVLCTKFPTAPVEIPGVKKPVSVKLLGLDGAVKYSFKNDALTVQPPAINGGNTNLKYAWVFKLEGAL
jgi:alpha-L-fucosidase